MIHPDSPHEVHPLFRNIGRTGPESKWEGITGKTKPSGRACWSRFCRGERPTRGLVCNKCYSRLRRLNDPLRATFDILKTNAKRRKKLFDLTFSKFKQFNEEHGYMEGKGRHAGALHIERKDPLKGYTYDNLTVLECTVNSAKGAVEDKLRHYNHQPTQGELEDVGF
jgi:hypothetical protein